MMVTPHPTAVGLHSLKKTYIDWNCLNIFENKLHNSYTNKRGEA